MRLSMPDVTCACPGIDRSGLRSRPKAHVRLILVACALAHGLAAQAQAPRETTDEPLGLKTSPRLEEGIGPSTRNAQPTFLFGERTTGRTDLETILEGDAILRRGDTVIRADRLEYYQPDDLARARVAMCASTALATCMKARSWS